MRSIASWTLVLASFSIVRAGIELQNYEDEDSVVIYASTEESGSSHDSARKVRDLDIERSRLRGSNCLTTKGEVGKCATFKDCYPFFKIPDLSALEGWVLGVYDTCSYHQKGGKVSFGICCLNPSVSSEDIGSTNDNDPAENIVAEQQIKLKPNNEDQPHEINEVVRVPINSWPPPLPTHPPHHTIPPLPTHPPNHGIYLGTFPTHQFPGGFPVGSFPSYPSYFPIGLPGFVITQTRPVVSVTTTVPSTTTITTTTTTKRSIVTKPTRPTPTQESETFSSVSSPVNPIIASASCGAKNGAQDINEQDDSKIVGGTDAQIGEWPWIVALFNAGKHLCGGSLIDNVHILTAAHCVAKMNSWDVARLTVRLGDHDIRNPYEVNHVERRVKRVVRHRGFEFRTLYNDVAILTMNEPVKFSEQIRPICLPSGSKLYAGNSGVVIGWGSLREMGPAPAVLQQVTVPIWSNTVCKEKYGTAAPGGILDSVICAGNAAKDSCSGDSGGPLMVNAGRWTQVGIVSWGIGCGKGQFPGVYTRVTHFLPWIHKNLK